MIESTSHPRVIADLSPTSVVEIDVREDLRQGREPFTRIMDAREALSEGEVLVVRAIFEPAPLYGVMQGHGFDHVTEELGPEDWRVWFYIPPDAEADRAAADEGSATQSSDEAMTTEGGEEEEFVVLDVRDLEPPEPMVRTLMALEELPPDRTLLQINVRVPQFLLPQLEARGFEYEIREQPGGPVRVFIRHSRGAA